MKFRAVHEALFSDPTFIEAEPEDRWLMVCLLISPHANMIGCYRYPKSYVSEDSKYPIDRVSIGFRYLIQRGFMRYCERTGWVWLRQYLKYNPANGPKQAAAANRLISEIPKQACFFNELVCHFGENYPDFEVPKPYPIDTLSIPLARGGAPDQDQDQDQYSRSANADSSSASDDAGERDPPELDGPAESTPGSGDVVVAEPTGAEQPRKLPDRAFQIWLDVVGNALPVPQDLHRNRRRKLELRLKESFGNDLERWRTCCARIRGSPHLTGDNDRGWKASFDWCLKPENLTKILEGNYDGPRSVVGGAATATDGKRRGVAASHDATIAELRRRRAAGG